MEHQGRILIADDEETFLFSTADLLRQRGFECDCARDSQSAEKMLREQQYDLLIADIKMPGNDDLEFIRTLDRQKLTLPVILVTAYPSLKSAMESVQLPVVVYLVKPIDIDELVPHIRTAISRSQIREIVQRSKAQLLTWTKDLENIEASENSKANQGTSISVDTFLALTLQNITNSLTDLRGLTEIFAGITGERYVCQLLNCPRAIRLTAGINETLRVLEKTKKAFKSKDLAELRQKLEALLRREGVQL